MKKVVIGILAHVDAGKTTLTEAMLYTSGAIRKLGRVDHKDSFLDNYEQERKRGITIFSKIAKIEHNDVEFTIVDTPGHVDFAAEMERTLQVLDYAILVVNGREGIQGHTHTLAKLLILILGKLINNAYSNYLQIWHKTRKFCCTIKGWLLIFWLNQHHNLIGHKLLLTSHKQRKLLLTTSL